MLEVSSFFSIITAIVVVLFFLWAKREKKELDKNIAILRNEIEDLKRNQYKQKQDIKKAEVEESKEELDEELEELQLKKETEISEPEPKLPETHRKETFYLGMPNAKGFLKEESQRAGYFIAQEKNSNKASFLFVDDQAKLDVIFKNEMEGKYYKVEKGIALPGNALKSQAKGLLRKKGDFWIVQTPITIELGN
ncbi:MAG: hypothetical protein FWF67_08405 [Fibromonadales bacterium]|nr:hypothetical protein [Fibromonadales bacterium]